MKYIENANIVLEKGILWDGAVLIDRDRIAAVGERGSFDVPEGAQRFDAQGLYIGPGFVDIHVHGGNGCNFFDNPEEAAKFFLSHGETTVLATSYTIYTKDEYLTSISKIQKAMKNGAGNIAGFYMEGPYLNPKYGASPEMNKWLGDIKREDYADVVDMAGADAKVWAIAPEREGVEEFMEYAKSVNPDTVFAVAHSEATPSEIDKLKKYGIKIQTHCMNATGRVGGGNGIRAAGPDEYCLLNDDMYAELICDSMAIHVQEALQRLILKVKGIDKIALITDSFATGFDPMEKYQKAKDLSFDANGDLSGSRLTMDVVCQNFMKHTGCGICEAFLAASRNPANAIGMGDEIGTVEVGKKANLVFVDDKFNIKSVMLEGKTEVMGN